jgi:hypothetical protein
MTLRRGLCLVVVLAVAAVAVAACSSSSKSSGAAGSQDTNADSGACPFSGSTQPQSQPGDSAPTVLTGASPQTDGCIDNVQLKFSPTLAASHFEYESGAPVLAVTLTGATLGGGLAAGTTQNPKNFNHVQKSWCPRRRAV